MSRATCWFCHADTVGCDKSYDPRENSQWKKYVTST